MRVPVDDSQDEEICEFFNASNRFISEALQGGGVVLVHCKHGQSRSATVIASYLMSIEEGLAASSVVERLQRVRSKISPNPGFLEQLRRFEAMKSLAVSLP